jgi:cytochrome c biogenesis protein CcdA
VNGFIARCSWHSPEPVGAFEITLPRPSLRKWTKPRDAAASRARADGLTFSLTSFACVGPLVGTLLAAS